MQHSSSTKLLLRLFMVAPIPFFILGIPCAPGPPSWAFSLTCLIFATHSAAALIWTSSSQFLLHIAMIANESASGIISAFWCAGDAVWVGLVVVETSFVIFSGALLEPIKGLTSTLFHVMFVLIVSIGGFALRDKFAALIQHGSTKQSRRLDESQEDWAVRIIVLVGCLIGGMVALGKARPMYMWFVSRCQRRDAKRVVPADLSSRSENKSIVPEMWIVTEARNTNGAETIAMANHAASELSTAIHSIESVGETSDSPSEPDYLTRRDLLNSDEITNIPGSVLSTTNFMPEKISSSLPAATLYGQPEKLYVEETSKDSASIYASAGNANLPWVSKGETSKMQQRILRVAFVTWRLQARSFLSYRVAKKVDVGETGEDDVSICASAGSSNLPWHSEGATRSMQLQILLELFVNWRTYATRMASYRGSPTIQRCRAQRSLTESLLEGVLKIHDIAKSTYSLVAGSRPSTAGASASSDSFSFEFRAVDELFSRDVFGNVTADFPELRGDDLERIEAYDDEFFDPEDILSELPI